MTGERTERRIPYSVLDLAIVPSGATPADALRNTLDLAQHAENWGYRRFWLAEHHNIVGIASAATAVVIGYVAAGTRTIRVGAGGIMLPNHAPLVIAEQFGTLESLYPGRIDLGLGRAPEPTRLRSGPCDAIRRVPTVFPRTCWSCRPTSRPRERARQSGPSQAPASTCRFGCWDQVCSGPIWQRNWGCLTHSPRISRRVR